MHWFQRKFLFREVEGTGSNNLQKNNAEVGAASRKKVGIEAEICIAI